MSVVGMWFSKESRIEQVEAEGRQLQEALSRALQAEQDAKRRLELLEAGRGT